LASTRCSTASAKSTRRCCSQPTATSTTVRVSILYRPSGRLRRACKASRPSSSSHTEPTTPT
jgi:hypothetical protein